MKIFLICFFCPIPHQRRRVKKNANESFLELSSVSGEVEPFEGGGQGVHQSIQPRALHSKQ